MRAILIDPKQRTVTEIDLPETPYTKQLDGVALGEALGCNWIDRVALLPAEDLWIDDEGRLSYPNPHGYFTIGNSEVFCGRGVILGNGGLGDSRDTYLKIGEVTRLVRWADTPEREDIEPRFEILPWPDPEGD